jgi:hypothetical protein
VSPSAPHDLTPAGAVQAVIAAGVSLTRDGAEVALVSQLGCGARSPVNRHTISIAASVTTTLLRVATDGPTIQASRSTP